MDITGKNASPLIKKKVIHTDFCDIHIAIDKKSNQPTDDAYITISDTQKIWLINNPDSVFLPVYFFDAFNKSSFEDGQGNKIIPLCKSSILNSNSYNGYDSEQTFPAWNFQIKGDYQDKIDNGICLSTCTNPHFLKIFHDKDGNCDVVQAGEFNSQSGRNLNVGYTKKIATLDEQLSKKYQAGLFTDKAEKMDNFIATFANYDKPGKIGSITENRGGKIIISKNKKMPNRLCQNLDSQWNAAICRNVDYNGSNFTVNFINLSTRDLETIKLNKTEMGSKELIIKEDSAVNYLTQEQTYIHTADIHEDAGVQHDIFESTYVFDQTTGLACKKVARISVKKKKISFQMNVDI